MEPVDPDSIGPEMSASGNEASDSEPESHRTRDAPCSGGPKVGTHRDLMRGSMVLRESTAKSEVVARQGAFSLAFYEKSPKPCGIN